MASTTFHFNQLEWHKTVAGPHRSAKASDPNGGYYALHKSGDTDITTFHMYPFYRIGIYPGVANAMAVCQWLADHS